MGIGKAIGVGIAALLGFSALVTILVLIFYGLDTGDAFGPLMLFFGEFATNWSSAISRLLTGPVYIYHPLASDLFIMYPWFQQMGDIATFFSSTFITGNLFSGLGAVLAIALMFVIAIIVGYLSHGPVAGLGAMMIVTAVGTVLRGTAMILVGTFVPTDIATLFILIATFAIPIVMNGLALGCISALVGYKYEE